MHILKTRKGREVEVLEVDYGREVDDTFIVSAVYLDVADEALADVPEDVLNDLQEDYAEELSEAWFEHQVGRSDFDYND